MYVREQMPHAMKWVDEPPRTCCLGGKCNFPNFPCHPPFLQEHWEGQESIVPGGGWVPSVIFQGKVFIGMGPLQPNDGTPPVYSQLYVLDPDQEQSEIDLRFHNTTLPSNTPTSEKQTLLQLLHLLRAQLRHSNPYTQDFLSAAEIVATEGSINLIYF